MRPPSLRTEIFLLVVKAFLVFAVCITLARWAAQALNAHDDRLFWFGLGSAAAGLAALFFGGFWVADGVHNLIHRLKEKQ